MDNELKRALIMENYSNPKNRFRSSEEYLKVNSANSSCIDNIDVYILFKDNIISDITFEGEACAISIASTSIMIKTLIGKTKQEALEYINEFTKMTEGKPYNIELIKEGNAFDEIYKQGNRRTCATLPYRALKKAIEDNL